MNDLFLYDVPVSQGILPYFDQMIGKITVKLDQKLLGEITVKWFMA